MWDSSTTVCSVQSPSAQLSPTPDKYACTTRRAFPEDLVLPLPAVRITIRPILNTVIIIIIIIIIINGEISVAFILVTPKTARTRRPNTQKRQHVR